MKAKFYKIHNIQNYDFMMNELGIQMATFFYHEGMLYIYNDKENKGLQELISSQIDPNDVFEETGKFSFIVKRKIL